MSSVWWDRRDLMRSKRRGNKTEARWACLGRSPWVAARRRFPMTSAGVRLPGGLGGGPMVRDIGSWSCHGGSSLESVSLSGCLGRRGETWPSPRLRLEMQLNRWRHRMRHSRQCWTVLGPRFLGGLRSRGPAVWGSRREVHRPRSVRRSWSSVSESNGRRLALAVSSSDDTRLGLLHNG